MSKIVLLTGVCFLLGASLYAQHISEKKVINNFSQAEWNELSPGNYDITGDGKLVFYSTKGGEITIVSPNKDFKRTIGGVFVPSCFFTADGKKIGYKSDIGDSFVLLNFLLNKADTIKNVESHSLIDDNEVETLLYKSKGKLIIRNLLLRQSEIIAEAVDRYWVNEQKTAIVFTSKDGTFWWDVNKKQSLKIMDQTNIQNTSFDNSGSKFLFSYTSGKNDELVIGCFKAVTNSIIWIHNNAAGIEKSFFIINGPLKFNSDGEYIIFTLARNQTEDKYTAQYKEQIKLWSSDQDRYLEERDKIPVVSYAIKSIKLQGSKIIQLDHGHDELSGNPGKGIMIIKRNFVSSSEQTLDIRNIPEFRVLNLKDGSQLKIVPSNHQVMGSIYLSPSEKFIYWYNVADDGIYTYELRNKKLRNVTQHIIVPKDIRLQNEGSSAHRFYNRVGLQNQRQWLRGDRAFLIKDKFDIWQVDPTAECDPINLTTAYGRTGQIKFDFLPFNRGENFKNGDSIVLRVQNKSNLDNGFATIKLGAKNSLKMGKLSSCLYSWGTWSAASSPAIKKARNNSVWLICKQTASESPNLVLTNDFKSYLNISEIHPEKEFNWLKSELIKYPIIGRGEGRGILYKPENFDPLKKYPVIFHYYQDKSDELHLFLHPNLSFGGLNILWYVSNGYIVCVPDVINDQPGKIAETTLNSVNAAVDYISRNSWIDTTKMGLQGHSFGGYETNLLITGSKRFAAAQSSAGISDVISGATGFPFGLPGFWMYEDGQFNLNCTVWECSDRYLKNSPILKADQITTPLFLMHNRDDYAVPFGQSEGFFYALRRLKKPVWLVQYKDEGHTLGNSDNKVDFTIRQQQFFDHFLKGNPKPKWMVDGTLSLELENPSRSELNK